MIRLLGLLIIFIFDVTEKSATGLSPFYALTQAVLVLFPNPSPPIVQRMGHTN